MSNVQAEAKPLAIHTPSEIQQAPTQSSESAAILSLIERAARDPNVDIDKMERLWAMKERVKADASREAFNQAMAAAQAKIPAIVRDAENSHTKSRYARLETIAAKVTPIITEHGFSMSFDTADSPHKDHYRLTCTVSHAGGHTREYHADLPSDVAGSQGKANKTAIQGFGSTMSYGRRYLTMLIFNVAIANEDNDGNAARAPAEDDGPTLSDEQIKQIEDAIAFKGVNRDKFLKYVLKVSALENVYASKFEAILEMIRKSGAAK